MKKKMAGPNEEQLNELEALKSIYFEEFQELSQEPVRFSISFAADPNSTNEPQAHEVEPCKVTVVFEFGPTYPTDVPEIEYEDIDLDEGDEDILRSSLSTLAEENKGGAMVFTLATFIKEWLDQKFLERISKYSAEQERKAKEAEERENARFVGTMVTPAVFAQWKKNFDAEIALKRSKDREKALQDMKKRKLTGRQLFETDSSLVSSEGLDEGDEVVEVDASLFTMGGLEEESDDEDRSFLYED